MAGNAQNAYVPPDDDPVKETTLETEWVDTQTETPDQMLHDPNVMIAIGSTIGIMALLMVCTAQQTMNNPDGFCAR